jgi:diguanylate cyclase (GGDEF)-like protein
MEFAVCMLDVDHFKKVNDDNGHVYGDRLLQEIASLIDDCVRETDIVTRYGGGEFVVVMPSTQLAGSAIFAERVRSSVEAQLGITVSGGLAQATAGDDPKTLLGRVDAALYQAKATGRNKVCTHTGEKVVELPVGEDEMPNNQPDGADQLLQEVMSLDRSIQSFLLSAEMINEARSL